MISQGDPSHFGDYSLLLHADCGDKSFKDVHVVFYSLADGIMVVAQTSADSFDLVGGSGRPHAATADDGVIYPGLRDRNRKCHLTPVAAAGGSAPGKSGGGFPRCACDR